ncbi:MAG TPA: nucleoside triphosphate pyrophosphohydrolase [Methylomirabilota bacterium]|nr:nucleoside triphosphate pyrophosphohydrolase [Methylomirabilota bacterium]
MPPRKSRRKPSKSAKKSPSRSKGKSSSKIGRDFEKLVAVMARLRAPGGCPWDREQTHATLRTYLIEEAYEVLDALDSTDDAKFAEELGDLLLQVLFHAQIAHEEKRFSISDVIREIHDKMVRRHPHVFGTTTAKTAADVLRNWEIIKKEERASKQSSLSNKSRHSERSQESLLGAPGAASAPGDSAEASVSVLDGVPRTLPALLEALQLTRKAARIGFDWPNIDGIFAKLTEETEELQTALVHSENDPSRIEGELGDILFVAVNLARFLHVDPELALRKTSAKFTRRFHRMEQFAREKGTTLAQIRREQLESYWDRAKLLD